MTGKDVKKFILGPLLVPLLFVVLGNAGQEIRTSTSFTLFLIQYVDVDSGPISLSYFPFIFIII